MKFESYDEMIAGEKAREAYFLQRANDLLEQIERLKRLTASDGTDGRTAIDAALAIRELHEAVREII